MCLFSQYMIYIGLAFKYSNISNFYFLEMLTWDSLVLGIILNFVKVAVQVHFHVYMLLLFINNNNRNYYCCCGCCYCCCCCYYCGLTKKFFNQIPILYCSSSLIEHNHFFTPFQDHVPRQGIFFYLLQATLAVCSKPKLNTVIVEPSA